MAKRRFRAVAWGVGALLFGLALLLIADARSRALYRYRAEASELVVPVEGVKAASLSGSFGDPRSGGRSHEGIDIFAPRGTPVVAATEGEVARVGRDRLGGNVVWVAGAGARLYYYAHLDRFADGIAPGDAVRPGTVLGYVGTTGNARGTPPHLHFGVYPAALGFRAIDPAPWLRERGRTRPVERVATARPR
jgi:murein DD-endopeptidase MepM/ murein hydrolase activator NlpD